MLPDVVACGESSSTTIRRSILVDCGTFSDELDTILEDEDRKIFKDRPKHDWTSHAADAFRYLAVCWAEEAKIEKKDDKPRGLHVGKTEVTLNELWETSPKTQVGRI